MNAMLRFFAVTVLGVVLDIAIAFGLHEGLGTPLPIAAVIGFICAAAANYVLHQLWSFKDAPRGLSWARAAKYGAVAAITLAVRAGVVAALDAYLAQGFALLILICGAGVSFFVNFTLSKLFVFSEDAREGEHAR